MEECMQYEPKHALRGPRAAPWVTTRGFALPVFSALSALTALLRVAHALALALALARGWHGRAGGPRRPPGGLQRQSGVQHGPAAHSPRSRNKLSQLLQSLSTPGTARRPTGMPRPATGAPAGLALRVVASSGEALPGRLLARLRAALPPGARVLNLYGSTEVAADVTCLNASVWAAAGAARARTGPDRGAGRAGSPAAATAAAAPSAASEPMYEGGGARQDPTLNLSSGPTVPAGAPIDNTTVFIARLGACGAPRGGGAPSGAVDAGAPAPQDGDGSGGRRPGRPALVLAALGEVGEVCVAGAGLASGYLRCEPGPPACALPRAETGISCCMHCQATILCGRAHAVAAHIRATRGCSCSRLGCENKARWIAPCFEAVRCLRRPRGGAYPARCSA